MSVEVELKLMLEREEYERLRHGLGEPNRVLRQRNVYFEDAEEPRLWYRHGFAVRLREIDGQWTLTVKAASRSDDDWTARPEWELQLDAGDAEAMLEGGEPLLRACIDLVDDLPEALRHSQPAPRGELHNERRQHEGVVEEAVLELDRYELPDGSVWHELEMEWHAAEGARQAAERDLRRLFEHHGIGWKPSSVSKRERFERALELRGS